jgi:hypothetical protein
MLKTIFNTILLFALLVGNMTLINWYISQLDLGKVPTEKTLINSVQADAVPANKDFSYLINQKSKGHIQSSILHEENVDKQEITLKFKETSIYLDRTEQKQFMEKLKTLKLKHTSRVQVLTGPAPGGENVLTLQMTKLRAQNVARLIYPYTQFVKMRYLPSLEAGTVIVEFYQALDTTDHAKN